MVHLRLRFCKTCDTRSDGLPSYGRGENDTVGRAREDAGARGDDWRGSGPARGQLFGVTASPNQNSFHENH
eukprot:6406467-Prymnesium_polylepis.1